MLRQILDFFCIPFDLVTMGPYFASNSGLFCIPFDFLTTGSYVRKYLFENCLKEIHGFAPLFNPSRAMR